MNSRITGLGSYLPEKQLTSAKMAGQLGVDEDWITSRCGVKTRSISDDNESSATMGYLAAKQALENAKLDPKDIDLIIFSTSTPERMFPSCACIIQDLLGNTHCPVFDLNATCSGFVYGLSIADKFIRFGEAKNVLVIGSESPAKYMRLDRPEVAILFGDGAGAAVLTASEEEGIIDTYLGGNGKYGDILATSTIQESLNSPDNFDISMDGPALFKQATKTMALSIEKILKRNNLTADDIDWVVPHQANERILLTTIKLARFPLEKTIITVKDHANTSSASVPLALHTAMNDGRIKPGDLCLFVTFGAGFVWGCTLVRI